MERSSASPVTWGTPATATPTRSASSASVLGVRAAPRQRGRAESLRQRLCRALACVSWPGKPELSTLALARRSVGALPQPPPTLAGPAPACWPHRPLRPSRSVPPSGLSASSWSALPVRPFTSSSPRSGLSCSVGQPGSGPGHVFQPLEQVLSFSFCFLAQYSTPDTLILISGLSAAAAL